MRKSVKMIALALALVLCTAFLVSCSSFGSIQRSFEKNGYTLKTEEKDTTGEIKLEEGTITYTIHIFQKAGDGILGGITEALSTATVWEFSSDADLEKALESDEIKALVKDAQESDFVNGNCVLVTINPDAVAIFKGEK